MEEDNTHTVDQDNHMVEEEEGGSLQLQVEDCMLKEEDEEGKEKDGEEGKEEEEDKGLFFLLHLFKEIQHNNTNTHIYIKSITLSINKERRREGEHKPA